MTGAALALALAFAGAPPSKVATVVAAADVAAPEAAAARQRVRAAIEAHPDLDPIDAQAEVRLFARPARRDPAPDVREARGFLRAADEAFRGFELARAEEQVSKARQALSSWRGRPEAVELERKMLELAVAIAHASRLASGIEAALREYAARFAEPPAKGLWPPALGDRMRALRRAMGTAVLEVRSDPPGSVFVDGDAAGETPLRIETLPAGVHRVVVRKDGFQEADVTVDTGAGEPEIFEIALKRDFSASLARLAPAAPIDPGLKKAVVDEARAAGAELVLLVFPASSAAGRLALQRLDREDEKNARTSAVAADQNAIASAVALLLAPPAASAAADPPQNGEGGLPRWAWIGGGVGVAAAATGVALRLAAVSTRRELDAREGALTQVQAYDLKSAGDREAIGGAVLLGVGSAAVTGLIAWWLIDAATNGSTP